MRWTLFKQHKREMGFAGLVRGSCRSGLILGCLAREAQFVRSLGAW
jgi:hypothetical protein